MRFSKDLLAVCLRLLSSAACPAHPPFPKRTETCCRGGLYRPCRRTTSLIPRIPSLLGTTVANDHAVVDTDQDGVPNISVLGLSGGGSNGAFAAGLLSGWTESGDRPEFKVVTGVSTGALIATFAFLGPEYDDALGQLYTTITDDQIFRRRGPLSVLFDDSLRSTSPLRETVARWISPAVLERVAAEHRKGRRLYVATTNLDGNRLVAWDLGEIAASNRADRLQRYHDVLIASSAVPVAFPPVYFPVTVDETQYFQMHVDGGASANIFLCGFYVRRAARDRGTQNRQGRGGGFLSYRQQSARAATTGPASGRECN